MKKCPKCGTDNPDEMAFCWKDQEPLQGQEAPKQTADIVFCFDTTGSMGDDIADLQANAVKFAQDLNDAGVHYKLGLVEYRDLKIGEPMKIVVPLSESSIEFHNQVQALTADGGGDAPESAVDAVFEALTMDGYRGDPVRKYIVLVTDAPPHDPDQSERTVDDMIAAVAQNGCRLMLVVPEIDVYKNIKNKLGGRAELIPIIDSGTGQRTGFARVLDRVVKGTMVAAGGL